MAWTQTDAGTVVVEWTADDGTTVSVEIELLCDADDVTGQRTT